MSSRYSISSGATFLSAWSDMTIKLQQHEQEWETFSLERGDDNKLRVKTYHNTYLSFRDGVLAQVRDVDAASCLAEEGALVFDDGTSFSVTGLGLFHIRESDFMPPMNTLRFTPHEGTRSSQHTTSLLLDGTAQYKKWYGNHRSGWAYSISCFEKYAVHPDAILFDTFLEKTFLWNRAHEEAAVTYTRPWVGCIHNPHNIPARLTYHKHSPQQLLKLPHFLESMKHCVGIYVLSEYLKAYLQNLSVFRGVLIDVVTHPTETPKLKFSMARYRENRDKCVIQLGYWLRKKYSIVNLDVDRKKAIMPADGRMQWEMQHEIEKDGVVLKNPMDSVTFIPHTTNEEFDELLSKNIVFLDLYDSSANNAIVECMVRNTPLVVNKLAAVVEYLGHEYPLYFETLEEASTKIQDDSLVERAHDYLKALPASRLSIGTFEQQVLTSRIYRSLQKKQSFPSHRVIVSLDHEASNEHLYDTSTIINQHCGDVVRLVAESMPLKIHYRSKREDWWNGLAPTKSSIFVFVGFFSYFMYFWRTNPQMVRVMKSFKRVCFWFDDLTDWAIHNKWAQHKQVIDDMKVHVFHPCKSQCDKLRLLGFDADYVQWSAERLEHLNVKKSANILTVYFDFDHRFQYSTVSSPDVVVRALLKLCDAGYYVRVHSTTDLQATHARLTATSGRLSYTDIINYFCQSHVYITTVRGSYEFSVLESQLCGNYVVQYGNGNIHEEHLGPVHVLTAIDQNEMDMHLSDIVKTLADERAADAIRSYAKVKYSSAEAARQFREALIDM